MRIKRECYMNKSLILGLVLCAFSAQGAFDYHAWMIEESPECAGYGFNNGTPTSNGEYLVTQHLINDGDLVFDVGANVGDWSKEVLAHHQNIHIEAFEPVPPVCNQVRKNLAGLPVTIHQLALFSSETTKTFVFYPTESQLSGFNDRPVIANFPHEQIVVPTTTLDAFCKKNNIFHINFLKIDTEGGEVDIFRGASDLLSNQAIDAIQFEYGGCYTDAKTTLKEAYTTLHAHGYEIFRITQDKLIHIAQWHDTLENYQYSNYLALNKHHPWLNNGKKSFVIVSPSRNNKEWCKRHLDSIFSQTCTDWRLIYIDDASTDGTGDLVEKYVKERGMASKVTLLKNTERHDKLFNVHRAINSCDPHEIVVMLDADDWFYDDSVLDYVRSMYSEPNIWLTYGQYMYWPEMRRGTAAELPAYVIANNGMRNYPYVTSHLKTFYARLFHNIKLIDLQYEAKFIRGIDDVAYMDPMLEMAGKHSKFIDKYLYYFNFTSSDVAMHHEHDTMLAHYYYYVATRARYQPLVSLF